MIVLVTDSTAYLTAAEAASLGVMVLPMTYSVDANAPINERYVDDNGDFERLIRENPTTLRTSQVPCARFQQAFEELTRSGHQVLCLTMSSRLSGTFANALTAARELPGAPIRVVDSLTTAAGLYLLVREARSLLFRGATIDEAADRLLQMRKQAYTYFSVDDMEPLRRSGRLGGIKKSVSTILNLRPMLKCEDGSILSYAVVRGQNEQRRALLKAVPENVGQSVVVEHLMADERALKLADALREQGKAVEMRKVGPVLGIHLGIGCLGVSWIGDKPNL